MTRFLLSLSCAAAVVAFTSPALAQPADGLPLPASPAPVTSATSPSPSTARKLTDIGLAIGDYVWSLTEDSEVRADTWLTTRRGLQSGVTLRFISRAIDAAVDVPATDGAASGHRVRFEDVIAGRVLVDVKLDARELAGVNARDELVSLGYKLADDPNATIVRFELRGFEEEAVNARVRRYRLIAQPEPFAIEADDLADWIGVRWRVRVGIEHARVNGEGAPRLVWGSETALRLGEYREVHLTVHVDSEMAVGLKDLSPWTPSAGMTNRVDVSLGAGDRWSAGLSVTDEREAETFGVKTSTDVLRRTTYTAEASFRVGADGIRLRPSISLISVKNRLNPNLPFDQTRFRAALQADLNEYFTVGAELRRDLDGRTRPMVTAGVRIPLR